MVDISRFGTLRRFVGPRRERRYLYGTLLLYVVGVAALSYATVESVDAVLRGLEEGGRTFEEDDADGGGVFVETALGSAIVAAVLARWVAYARVAGPSVTGLVKGGLYSVPGFAFWSLALSFLIAIPGAVLYVGAGLVLVLLETGERGLLIYAGAFMELLFLLSFGLASAVVVWRTNYAFPADLREAADRLHSTVEDLDDADANLDRSDIAEAAEALDAAREKFDSVADGESTVAGGLYLFEAVEVRLRETAARAVDEAISMAGRAAEAGHYKNAEYSLTIAEGVADRFGLEHGEIGPLREDVESATAEIREDRAESFRDRLDRAEAARTSGDFREARRHLAAAERELRGIRNVAGDADPNGVATDLESVRERIQRDETRAEMRSVRASVADSLGLDRSAVRLDAEGESLEAYERLDELVRGVRAAKSAHPAVPWDELERALVDELSTLSRDRLAEYERILAGSREVLSYLETVNPSHPSIDAEGWQNAVVTAVEEGYPNVLDPVVSQIDRLKTGLWNRDHLHQFTWQEFERLVGSLYEARGYSVEVTRGTADLGVDVWAERSGERVAIQVKQYGDGNTVGRETLQKLASTLAKGDADRAVVVTSGTFARTAVRYADDFGSPLEIVDGDELVRLLSESDLPPPV